MKLYDVRFKIAASFGGGEKTVRVRAADSTAAGVAGFMALDEQGITHCALISITEATS